MQTRGRGEAAAVVDATTAAAAPDAACESTIAIVVKNEFVDRRRCGGGLAPRSRAGVQIVLRGARTEGEGIRETRSEERAVRELRFVEERENGKERETKKKKIVCGQLSRGR